MNAMQAGSRYLDALVRSDASELVLAPDVTRTINGAASTRGDDELRDGISREPELSMGDLRWVDAGDEAAVFYRLEATIGEETYPTCVGERFIVRDGALCEIEVVYAMTDVESVPFGAGVASGEVGESVVDAARSYVAALVSHDASAVPIGPEAKRIENGQATGEGAEGLAAALESEIMETVESIDNEHWFTAGDNAVVFYDLHASVGDDTMLVRIAERFRVGDGGLSEVEAVFAPVAG